MTCNTSAHSGAVSPCHLQHRKALRLHCVSPYGIFFCICFRNFPDQSFRMYLQLSRWLDRFLEHYVPMNSKLAHSPPPPPSPGKPVAFDTLPWGGNWTDRNLLGVRHYDHRGGEFDSLPWFYVSCRIAHKNSASLPSNAKAATISFCNHWWADI